MKASKYIIGITTLIIMASCALDEPAFEPQTSEESLKPIVISGRINQEYATRANDEGFCNGDVVGIYVVDYDGETAGVLQNEGNRADNVRFTFDETNYIWKPAYDIYWKDKKTHIDIYGYYPWGNPEDVENYAFELEKDQRREAANGQMGGYEASDFLWGKAEDNAPTASVIRLGFNHKMASVRVTLAEGIGFAEGEWAAAQKQVIILNTARKSTINLKTGMVTASDEIPTTGTIPFKSGDEYRAIVVPQTVAAGTNLLSVTVDGESYFLKKSEAMTYNPSKQHNFTMTVNKRPAGGGMEFVLSSESITVWENDPISHDAIAREYVTINVPVAGTLDSCIVASGKDLTKLRNLKLTGQINSKDFAIMRFKMDRLNALNLKEVRIVAGTDGFLIENNGDTYYGVNQDDEIPGSALKAKKILTSLVLPDRLKKIAGDSGGHGGSFAECVNLSGSLTIPEGVEELGCAVFADCRSLTGTLTLPSTLKKIGKVNGYDPGWDGAFAGCNFVCELKIPDSVEEIGMGTFLDCHNLYGELRLPDGLKAIGDAAFYGCSNLTGSLVIPLGVTRIPANCFYSTWLGGNLTLHDGITSIENSAFANTGLKGELRLPKDLEVVSDNAFYNCDFSGVLVLPENLYTIGNFAFAYNWRLMGTVEIPQNVISIGGGAFSNCRSIEGFIFPEGLESIRYDIGPNGEGEGPFVNCFGIGRIVCKGDIPAYVQNGAFDGVAKDNFTLEVPESSIHLYQTSNGWKDFKRISAYRNLVIRPSMATAINTTVTRDLVLTADDEWYVESQPDWVTLNKTSGKGKTEIKLTFAEMPTGSEPREGEVVFMLKGQDYRTRCKVTQYDYKYAEDEFITLQKATKGNGEINIVILGDGYNAKDISEGKLLDNVTEAYGHFFNIEPYRTYKDYFNVYTAISVSPESGIGSVNTIIYNRFNTTAKGGVGLGGRNDSDNQMIIDYACRAETVSADNLGKTLVMMIPNTYDYGGICYMWDEGFAIAYCPMSDYGYPMDFRGVIQHEAGGHGFGKLGDEYIYHNAFIDACGCTCCGHTDAIYGAKSLGWYDNLSLTGKMSEVPWSHLIFHDKYSEIVDIFEGGYMHTRGVYRSEHNSCMNNDIPYYSTISRESIVKRIKAYAGEEYSFEDFVANDVIEVDMTETKSFDGGYLYNNRASQQQEPVLMGSLQSLK